VLLSFHLSPVTHPEPVETIKELVIALSSVSIRRFHRHADIAGATASAVCMVHCLLTPVVISLFPDIIPYLPGDASFHRWLAIGIVLLGFAGFVPGYRVHRRKPLLALIAIGMCLILAVAWNGEGLNRTLELVLSVGGSMLLVMAHLLNRSFCRQCRLCKEVPGSCHTTEVEQLRPHA
jgi:hypothetical protein